MSIRKIYLKAMLCTIAALAALAVGVVMFYGERASNVMAVIIASGITLGVLSGLGFVFAIIAEKPWGRKAGLLGMGGIPVTLVCMLTGFWFEMVDRGGFFGRDAEQLILTGLLTFLFLIPAMGFLLGMNAPRGRIVGVAGAVMCGMIFTLILVQIWDENYAYGDFNYGEMALGVFYFSFPILGAMVGAGVDKRPWRYLGVALGVAGIVVFAVQLAEERFGRAWSIPVLLFSLSFVIAHANVLMLYPLKNIQRVVPVLTFVFGGFACGLAYYLSQTSQYVSNKWRDDDIERLLLLCLSILAFCGTAATLLLAAVNKKAERPKVVYTPIQKMQVVCPCCGERQELAPGEGRCVKCRLVIRTAFEEPKCENCGYSLLMLSSDKCPECGTIAPWGGVSGADVHVGD